MYKCISRVRYIIRVLIEYLMSFVQFVEDSPTGPHLCTTCGEETKLDLATHMFLDHTRHRKAYVCDECDTMDVVTHRFQRHLSYMHGHCIPEAERYFRSCVSFTKLLECAQPYCIFVTPSCETMCRHQVSAHATVPSGEGGAVARPPPVERESDDDDDAESMQDLDRYFAEAVEPPEERQRDQPVMVVRPATEQRREEPPARRASVRDETTIADRLRHALESGDRRDAARYRFVENLPPLPTLQQPRYFPLERAEAIARPEDFRYVAQLRFSPTRSAFLAADELFAIGDSVMMRDRAAPFHIIARIEARQHRGHPGTMRPGHRCGAMRPWKCSGVLVDTHSRPWGMLQRITLSAPPPAGYFIVVNAVYRTTVDVRVFNIEGA